ncbi:MAG TPA: ABC transporter permease, partial [Limnochordales bacterium]
FMYVGALMFGISWVVMEEREYFQIFKYIYISAAGMFWHLCGRAVAKFLITTVAVIILLAFGNAFLGVPLNLAQVDWGLFAAVFPLGIVTMVGLGFVLAGVMLIAARHGSGYVESVSGALYLLCGVVFPLDVLPGWLQAIGKAVPVTYWLEGLRRALLGQGFGQAFAGYSDAQLVVTLAVSSVLTLAVSVWFFDRMAWVARSRGLIDQLTEH